MTTLAQPRTLYLMLAVAILAVIVVTVALIAQFGLVVLGLLGLVLTVSFFVIMLTFTAGN